MSRWDESKNDDYNHEKILDVEQESQLLKKFHDYRELEKNEIEKKQFLEDSNKKNSRNWTSKFIISAIIQVAIIAGLTIFLLTAQLIYSEINIMHLLSNSFDDTSKWFFFGYIMYITLVLAIAVTAVFYNHVELNMKKQFRGVKNIFAWIHLLGMNVGGSISTLFLIWIGLQGSGIGNLVSFGAIDRDSQNKIMEQFTGVIEVSTSFFVIGILAGVIALLTTYFQKSSNFSKLAAKNSFHFNNIKTDFERL
jgi:hypothetical protein